VKICFLSFLTVISYGVGGWGIERFEFSRKKNEIVKKYEGKFLYNVHM